MLLNALRLLQLQRDRHEPSALPPDCTGEGRTETTPSLPYAHPGLPLALRLHFLFPVFVCPQVEPLGSAQGVLSSDWTSVVSQFASLDSSGTVTLWMSSGDTDARDLGSQDLDLGLSPWSSVKLVRNRVLRLQSPPTTVLRPVGPSSGTSASRGYGSSPASNGAGKTRDPDFVEGGAVCVSDPVLGSFPHERSMFLVSGAQGSVCKLMRYGDPTDPKQFGSSLAVKLSRDSMIRGITAIEQESFLPTYQAATTCMAIGSQTSTPVLILVGRSNGTVDLFQSTAADPIASWDLSDLNRKSSDSGRSKHSLVAIHAAVLVRWIPNKPSSFLAINDVGCCLYFDLIKDMEAPMLQEDILDIRFLRSSLIDLSSSRPGSTTAYLVFGYPATQKGGNSMELKRLTDIVLVKEEAGGRGEDGADREEEEKLRESMSAWIGRGLGRLGHQPATKNGDVRTIDDIANHRK